MRQRPENFKAADEDPEATLVAPRFDADDARRAHPVVPLAEAPQRARRVRNSRRAWTPALLAVALLAVAAIGGAVATKVLQSPRAERVQEQTQSAPVQTAEAPPPRPSTPTAAEATREDATAARPATRDARTRRARDDEAATPAAEPARVDVGDDEDREARGKAEKRRGREDDEVEKEVRKALKRAKGKAPRLVDVLTSP